MIVLRRVKYQWLFFILTCLSVYSVNATSLSEQQLKAAYLYNFSSYTQWPSGTGNELYLCVFAKPHVMNAFFELDGEKVSNRMLKVKDNLELGQISKCHIIYISQSEQKKLSVILKRIENKAILTVSDIPEQPNQGILITMYVKRNKIKFNINKKLAILKQLTISSRLLRLANKVEQ